MNPLYAKVVVIAASVAMVVIRAPHGHRAMKVKVVESRKGPLEVALLTLAWLSFFVPLVWVFTRLLAFADYPLHPLPFALGRVTYAARTKRLVPGIW